MPNVTIPNATLISGSSDFISSWWRLTRALKAAGWRYKASSDGTAKEVTGNPSLDKWGAGVQVGAQTATVSFTIAAPSTTAKGGRSVITGLTGFVAASAGRFLVITGATNGANNGTWLITKYVSATSVEIENPLAVAETTPGTATWTETSSVTDTMPVAFQGVSGSGAWWCAEGPSTMKIPIGATVPTGTFIRGENVVQTTTGATGEILGVMTDVVGGAGHLVIAPRASGTGAGPRGWGSANTITGSTSGATIVSAGTPIEYVRELVIWKGSASAVFGHMYFQCIDSANESTPGATVGRFSEMAALGTCTASVAPGGATGGAPSTNGFPTIGTYVICGQGGPATLATNQTRLFSGYSSTDAYGVCNAMCANNIEDVGISQDGSYILTISATAGSAYMGSAFQRCDDGEEGDVDPYVHWQVGAANYDAAPSTTARTIRSLEAAGVPATMTSAYIATNAYTPFIGSRRRGFATEDTHQFFQGAYLTYGTAVAIIAQNPGSADRVATAPVNTAVREPIVVHSTQYARKMRKGTLRWMYWVQGGSALDTYDTKSWVQLGTTAIATVGGPWDGVTTPTL